MGLFLSSWLAALLCVAGADALGLCLRPVSCLLLWCRRLFCLLRASGRGPAHGREYSSDEDGDGPYGTTEAGDVNYADATGAAAGRVTDERLRIAAPTVLRLLGLRAGISRSPRNRCDHCLDCEETLPARSLTSARGWSDWECPLCAC